MFLLTITSRRCERELWYQPRAVPEKSGRAHILPVCLWASQARRTRQWPHHYISYFHSTYSGCCFVWEEGAIMWYSIVGVCLESWRGEAEFWQSSYGISPNRATLFNGKNKSLLCHTLRNTVGCTVTLSPRTGHSTPLPSWNLGQLIILTFVSSSTDHIHYNLLDVLWTKASEGFC